MSTNRGEVQTDGVVTRGQDGLFRVTGDHTYDDAQSFTVKTTITTWYIQEGQNRSLVNSTIVRSSAQVSPPGILQVLPEDLTGQECADFSADDTPLARFTDTASAGAYTARIDWGDDTGVTGGQVIWDEATGTGTVFGSVSHEYHHAGNFSIRVRVADASANGRVAFALSTIHVLPEVAGGALQAVGMPFVGHAGTPLTDVIVANFTDTTPGMTASDYQVLVDWGDESAEQSGQVVEIAPGSFEVLGSHLYSDVSSFLVSAAISSPTESTVAFSTASITIPITVQTTPRTLFVPGNRQFDHELLASFVTSNPNDLAANYSAMIDWGDGTSVAGEVRGSGGHLYVAGSHKYAKDMIGNDQPEPGLDTYQVRITIRPSADSTDIVPYVPLVIDSIIQVTELAEGDSLTTRNLLTILDSNKLVGKYEFTADVNWGDGSALPPAIVEKYYSYPIFLVKAETPVSINGETVAGIHRYANEGLFPLTITVHEENNEVAATATRIIAAANAPMQLVSNNADGFSAHIAGQATVALTSTLAVFSNPAFLSPFNTYSATIDWGDGTTSTGTITAILAGIYQVQGSHTYATHGTYQFSVFISDDGVNFLVANGTAEITEAPRPVWNLQAGTRSNDPDNAALTMIGRAVVSPNTGGLRVSHALDFDVSPGTSVGMNPSLVYNSDTVDVHPLIEATFQTNKDGTLPTEVQARLVWDGVAQSWVTFATAGRSPGDVLLLDLQAPGPFVETSAHTYHVDVSITVDGVTINRSSTDATMGVVVQEDNPFGAGWNLAGMSRLVFDDYGAFRVYGTGDGHYFSRNASGRFTSPPDDFGKLTNTCDETFTYTSKDGTRWLYNSDGVLLSITDRYGLTWVFGYTSGLLTSEVTPDGATTTFGYDNHDQVVSIHESGSRVVTLTHDQAGNLTSIEDVDGSSRTFTYNGFRLTGDAWGGETESFTYDATIGRLTDVNLGNGVHVSVHPVDGRGLDTVHMAAVPQSVATLTDALSHTTSYTLDLAGRSQQLVTADGAVQTWIRSPFGTGLLRFTVDPLTNKTIYTYDTRPNAKSDLLQVRTADGGVTTYSYEQQFHQISTVTDPLKHLTVYTYNLSQVNVTEITNALSDVTHQRSTSTGLLTSTTDALNHTTTFVYDSHRRLSVTIDALNHRTTYTYDNAGNLQTAKDALNRVTTTVYDAKNRLIEQIDAAGGESTWDYDNVGHVTSQNDRASRITEYAYDGHGWRTSVTEAQGTNEQRTTSFVYDLAGNILYTTDPLQRITLYAYDAVNRRTQTIEAWNTNVQRQTTTAYDLAGNVLSSTDFRGTVTSYAYDEVNRQTAVIEAFNVADLKRTTTIKYDLAGNVRRITAPLQKVTDYEYDNLNRRTKVTEAQMRSATTAFDKAGNVLSTTDFRGSVTSYAYDEVNRRTNTIEAFNDNALRRTLTTSYDSVGRILSNTDGLGNLTSYAYDAIDRNTVVIAAFGQDEATTTTMAYDRAGNVTEITDPLGHQTRYDYDALNRQTTVTDALTQTRGTAYNAADDVTSVTDTRSITTNYSYDELDRRTRIVEDAGAGGVSRTTTMAYDQAANVTSSTDPRGTETRYEYDALGRRTKVIEAVNVTGLGRSTQTAYDAGDHVTTVTDALNRVTTYRYDALGRKTLVTEPGGDAVRAATTITYDAGDNVLRTQQGNTFTRTEFDTLGRRTLVNISNLQTTTFAYDKADNLVGQTDPNRNRTAFAYDHLNRRTSVTEAVGTAIARTSTTLYDAAGNVTASLDPLSRRTETLYDALNRSTKVTEAVGTALQRATETAYDAAGNVTAVQDPLGHETDTEFDHLNRQTKVTEAVGSDQQRSTTTAFDLADNVTSVTDPLQHVTTFAFDRLNRRIGQTEAVGTDVQRSTTFAYDAADRLTSQTDARGTITSYAYNAADDRTAVIEAFGLQDLQRTTTYVYDNLGRLIAEKQPRDASANSAHVTQYGYDKANRQTLVVQVVGEQMRRVHTAYDANGNVTEVTDPMVNVTKYQYDELNRRTTVIEAANRAEQRTTQSAFDADNNLTKVTDPRGTVTAYEYDALNRQTRQVEAVGIAGQQRSTRTRYDLGNRVTELVQPLGYDLDASNNPVANPATRTTAYAYDDLNRRTAITEAVGVIDLQRTTSTEYDADNNVTAVHAPLFRSTNYRYDALNRRTLVEDALAGRTTTAYDLNDNVTRTTDALFHVTTAAYDALNRATSQTEAVGTSVQRRTTSAYDAGNRLTLQTDARGTLTSFAYDAADERTVVVEAYGQALVQRTTTFVYNADGQVTQEWHPRSNNNAGAYVTAYQYDGLGRQTEVVVGVNSTDRRTRTRYDKNGNVTAVTDALDVVTKFAYDRLNRRTAVTEADNYTYSRTTQTAYDAADNVTQVTDPRGTVTALGYDALGRQTVVTESVGVASQQRSTRTSYDLANNVIQVVKPIDYDLDANGNPVGAPATLTTRFAYDLLNRRTAVQEATGDTDLQRTTYTKYDALGNVTSVLAPLQRATTFEFDELNRRTRMSSPMSEVTTFAYDANNNLTSTTDPLGYRTTTAYDALNRRTEVITTQEEYYRSTLVGSPTSAITNYYYDRLDHVVRENDPVDQNTNYYYAADGTLLATDPPMGGRTETNYDALGRLTRMVDSLGLVTNYRYDALGRQTAVIDPVGNAVRTEYDAANNPVTVTDRDGRVRSIVYDRLNRRVQESWSDPINLSQNNVFSFRYDAADHLLSAVKVELFSIATQDYRYDSLGRQTYSRDLFGVVLTSSYDAADHRTRLEDSFGGVLTSVYDRDDRLTDRTLIANGTSLRVVETYTDRGELRSVQRFGWATDTDPGSITTYTYDSAGRVVAVEDKLSGDGTDVYGTYTSYDPAGRVTVEQNTFSKTQSLVTFMYSGPPAKVDADKLPQYNTLRRIVQDDGGSWQSEYDLSTNRTIRRTQNTVVGNTMDQYHFDAAGDVTDYVQVTGWVRDMGSSPEKAVTYSYDALGRRASVRNWDHNSFSSDTRTEERYSYDGDQVYLDLDSNNNLKTRYLLGDQPNQRLARVQVLAGVLGQGAWYITDRNGNTQQLTNAAGAMIMYYKADGSPTSKDLADRWRYAGQQTDAFTNYQYDSRTRLLTDPANGQTVNGDPRLLTTGDYNPGRNRGEQPVNKDDGSNDGWWSNFWKSSWLGGFLSETWGLIKSVGQLGWSVLTLDGRGIQDNLSGAWDHASNAGQILGKVIEPLVNLVSPLSWAQKIGGWLAGNSADTSIADAARAGTEMDTYLGSARDFGVGLADSLTVGLTKHLRDWSGGPDETDYSSSSFRIGGWAGQAIQIVATGGVGALKALGGKALGLVGLGGRAAASAAVATAEVAGTALVATEAAATGLTASRLYNGMRAVGHTLNAVEDARSGNGLGAVTNLIGAATAGVETINPKFDVCAAAPAVQAVWKGMNALNVAATGYNTVE